MRQFSQMILACMVVLLTYSTYAQDYLSPTPVTTDVAQIQVTDVVRSGEIIKFRLTIENITGDHYLAYSVKKTVYDLPDMGQVTAEGRDKLVIIPPGEKKWMVINGKVAEQGVYPRFSLNLNGLYKGKLPDAGVSSEMTTLTSGESATASFGSVAIKMDKVGQKKGTFSAQGVIELKGSLAAPKELLLVDKSTMTFSSGSMDDAGSPFIIYPSGKKKLKFELATDATSVDAGLGNGMKLMSLENVAVDPISVSDGSKIYKTCASHTADTDGSIKINISSEFGCFKYTVLGESLTPDYTSNLTYMMNPSTKAVKVIMDNGFVIEKSIYAKDDYKALYYKIKEKDDKYVLRYLPGASELADESKPADKEPKKAEGNQSSSAPPKYCNPVKASTQGPTLIKINSEVGCFHISVMGERMTQVPTSNFSFRAGNSSKKLKIVMEDGMTFEKTIFIGPDVATLYYNIKLKNGKYSLKQNLMAAEFSEQETSSGGGSTNPGVNYDECRMSSSAFGRLKASIESESFDKDKLKVANHAARNSCLSVYQIKQITTMFSFSAQQLDFAKTAYGNCPNKAEYYEVISVFDFQKDKNELENYIQNY